MQILLVEDDELLGDGLKNGLIQYGHTVEWVKDGVSAKIFLDAHRDAFEVIILDINLPKLSGLDLLRMLRSQGFSVPVLILTARDSTADLIRSLDSGADDYLVKPFNLDELCARLRALQRRFSSRTSPILEYKHVALDPSSHSVTVHGEPTNLSRREFTILQKLLENVGQVVSKQQLIQNLYGWEEGIDSNVIEVHVHNIRKKLNVEGIRTIRGIGYILEAER